jgi:ubiquinone/menaquinone biosynthesis C-methylase UbiE
LTQTKIGDNNPLIGPVFRPALSKPKLEFSMSATLDETVAALRSQIDEIRAITNTEWIESLEDRKLKELEFHDRDRDRKTEAKEGSDTYEKFYGNRKYYVATASSRQYTEDWISKHARDKVFLDYACGNGANAIAAARAGAKIALGLDISPVSVSNATDDAAKAGVRERTEFFQADCENTKLPTNSVDTIICSGMLHHLDLSYAFPELRRILKPGGRLLAVEALDYNPAIKLYRMMTPDMRTEWEKAHILSLADLRFAKRFFDVGEVRYWHILAIAAAKAGPVAPLLHQLDKVLVRVPGVQLMAWIFTFELMKQKSG